MKNIVFIKGYTGLDLDTETNWLRLMKNFDPTTKQIVVFHVYNKLISSFASRQNSYVQPLPEGFVI